MQIDGLTLQDIEETFSLMDDWEDRYRFLIELGQKLPPFNPENQTPEHKVKGCTSQVWIKAEETNDSPARLHLSGTSDAHIVKGLVAVLFLIFSGKTTEEIKNTDARAILDRLGLAQHLSPMRTNGLYSMVKRIQYLAEAAK